METSWCHVFVCLYTIMTLTSSIFVTVHSSSFFLRVSREHSCAQIWQLCGWCFLYRRPNHYQNSNVDYVLQMLLFQEDGSGIMNIGWMLVNGNFGRYNIFKIQLEQDVFLLYNGGCCLPYHQHMFRNGARLSRPKCMVSLRSSIHYH